jgi:excinuclease ABC subunit A
VSVDIPRNRLVVLTGLSGSGKSSLAFDTLYAEGQRRLLESLSTFARRFIQQQRKPKVDAILGLSPVISIEQKTVNKNPRSTVGTMTDLGDYLRQLYCSSGVARCLFCAHDVPIRGSHQITDLLLALPADTAVELCAPVFREYGEDYAYLFTELRSRSCKQIRIDGELRELADEFDLDETKEHVVEAVVDRFAVDPGRRKHVRVAIESALKVGDGFLRIRLPDAPPNGHEHSLLAQHSCPVHDLIVGDLEPWFFSFNEPDSACPTCTGLGTYLKVDTGLLVPDPGRSVLGGAFVPEAFRYDRNTWNGRMMHSLADRYGFSLETPFQELPPSIQDLLFHGTQGEKIPLIQSPGGTSGEHQIGRLYRFDGVANGVERTYRSYRKKQDGHGGMEDYLRKVMVEHTCPACAGTRLKPQRSRITVGGKTLFEIGQMPIEDLRDFLAASAAALARNPEVGAQIIGEVVAHLDLLIGIGLDYLNLNRRAGSLSGGESQRIRLSTQISSELIGLLYVLDEPSIGLHPKDNEKLIATLRQLRGIGNTVLVVEHDEDTIRAADHVIEIGPGPGIHGGAIVASGTVDNLMACPDSLTGAFLSGRRTIEVPNRRRPARAGHLAVRGARENNLRNIDVSIPLGMLVCITGASGSGKSTLIKDVLYKKLYSALHDNRVVPGAHDSVEGIDRIGGVVEIDQSPIGRSPRSNPATYIGFYDDIRALFASTVEATARGYSVGRFSFNVKGGRCDECSGDGIITTSLNFMPDVETVCPSCKGSRFNAETLEVTYRGKNIAEVLDLSVEEGAAFFADQKRIAHKLSVLDELGLGYLTLGQSCTTISGGEAQRVKLASELSRIRRGARTLYILDEPTTGLHMADIQRLLDCMDRLVEAGNSVLVIEHHMDVVKTADWVIDLGPDGGKRGGEIVAEGTPEEVARCPDSHTGRFLRTVLARSESRFSEIK